MNWYYSNGGDDKLGPVDDAGFERLVASGEITDATLVWSSGMSDWKPYADVRGGVALAAGMPDRPMARCAECGRTYPADDMIEYEGMKICAACKPVFFQKLREGVGVGSQLNYAGFWIRFGAVFVDGIILAIVNYGIGLVTMGVMASGNTSLYLFLVNFSMNTSVALAYETYMIGAYGRTLGKMAAGVKVVRSDGSRVGFLRAFGRYWAKQLSGLVFLIGYIMAAFDAEKRALHDRICDTRVIRTRG